MKILQKIEWSEIDTVLLDMDGTLLDLHFDNQFWLKHLPALLAERDAISLEQAQEQMRGEYEAVAGTLKWYCIDYWQQRLDLDIMQAKQALKHLIVMRDDTLPFLDALHASGREVVLVTNAHQKSLALKTAQTGLDQHIQHMVSTHEFGVSKEFLELWQRLQKKLQFDPAKTLFVDDNLSILATAQQFGIAQVLAVTNPDSQLPAKEIDSFPSVSDFRNMLDDILARVKYTQ